MKFYLDSTNRFRRMALMALPFLALGVLVAHPETNLNVTEWAIISLLLALVLFLRLSHRKHKELQAAYGIIDRMMQEQWVFLAETHKELTSSIDFNDTLRKVARIGVPIFADYCAIYLKDAKGQLILREEASVHQLEGSPETSRHSSWIAQVAARGRTESISPVSEECLTAAGMSSVRYQNLLSAGINSILAIPLQNHGETSGVLLLASTAARTSLRNPALAEQFAQRAALAIENARLYSEAQRAAQVREEIVSIISHDIRNPLAVIQLQSSLIEKLLNQSGPLATSQIKKSAEFIQFSSKQLKQLVTNLLEVARLEAASQPIRKDPFDLDLLIAEAVKTLRHLATEKSIEVQAEIPEGTLTVHGNRDSILQVILNLGENALKFTPERGLIRLRVVSLPEEIQVHVIDNGPGILQEHLPYVFDRYWQATHHGRAGAGLGLAICKNIIAAHQGSIWVESQPGNGSKFGFGLPRQAT